MSDIFKGAVISDCGQYRYQLVRHWDGTKSPLVFVMLNPSIADGKEDDPTIRKCMGFARENGFGGIEVYNLFAYRATNPKELIPLSGQTRIGPDNLDYIKSLDPFGTVVAAWGMFPYKYNDMFRQVEKVRDILGTDLKCVRQSGHDRPWHPLYVPYGPLLNLGDICLK